MPLKARIRRWAAERERARALAGTVTFAGGLAPEEQKSIEREVLSRENVARFLKRFPAEAPVVRKLLARLLAQVNRELADSAGEPGEEQRQGVILALLKDFIEELEDDIAQYQEVMKILQPIRGYLSGGWGLSSASLEPSTFDILVHFDKIRKNRPLIRKIADLLGRMHEAQRAYRSEKVKQAPSGQPQRLLHAGKSTLVGIHESADISSMLSSEAALLADPETEKIFYFKFAEKQLQTYDYRIDDFVRTGRRRAPRRRRGPMILILDTSGSMNGIPEHEAKAFVLAFAMIGLRQKRHVHVISFSTETKGLTLSPPGVPLRLLLHFLALSYHGGTDINVALDAGLAKLRDDRFHDADLIFLTDAMTDSFHEEQMRAMEEARQQGSRFYALIVGSHDNRRLTEQLDHSWRYERSRLEDLVIDLERHPPGTARRTRSPAK